MRAANQSRFNFERKRAELQTIIHPAPADATRPAKACRHVTICRSVEKFNELWAANGGSPNACESTQIRFCVPAQAHNPNNFRDGLKMHK
ncbi:hypothetical protein ZHAS_00002503 [Anopheles sinensis]|uniref:Uncharacterized protein n=1 Tax=Anopheles sinensis TaxID=74873 RepID=A0A084VCF2_ANOSI|nr:hypothetical protein ZHAS_00002503 [Anopheles sinensis]